MVPTGTNDRVSDAQHEQAFADAVQRSQAVQQMDAQPALTGDGFMSGMTQRLDAIASNLRVDPSGQTETAQQQSLFSGDPASAPGPQNMAAKPPEDLHALTQKALNVYRETIIYSVQAQVATNGSSTSTKTFNDLMKGS
ncbi:MAG: hypothetical protein ACRYG8_47240 [Janthinobacterium lividum]